MEAALKAHVLPKLRALGFAGSMPHFRRSRSGAVDLLCFQYRSGGGSFVVEIGRVAEDGFDFHGKHIPAAKAKVSHTRERHRLGSELRVNWGDHWYAFADRDADEVAKEVSAELDRDEVWALVDRLAVLGDGSKG
ncbi:DUF4304 domain-containing protein [Aurantiacibacter aquimixticola]|nr:DUF4304 domain-containing protein [Aurantiacibacter aquimixticola]